MSSGKGSRKQLKRRSGDCCAGFSGSGDSSPFKSNVVQRRRPAVSSAAWILPETVGRQFSSVDNGADRKGSWTSTWSTVDELLCTVIGMRRRGGEHSGGAKQRRKGGELRGRERVAGR
eukprot:3148620-Pleurochrysis_carterae.AAC.1